MNFFKFMLISSILVFSKLFGADVAYAVNETQIVLRPTKEDWAIRKTGAPALIKQSLILAGRERFWEEYVPTSYTGKGAVPLVVSLHGASGPSMPMGSSWHFIAEREGFIVVYPAAAMPELWNIWERNTDPTLDDVAYLDQVIAKVRERYNIDGERMYIHGISMGDNMASTYLFKRAELFAAAAPVAGPTLPSVLLDDAGKLKYFPLSPVPVLRLHGEFDTLAGFPSTHKLSQKEYDAHVSLEEQKKLRNMLDQIQKDMWIKQNECSEPPYLKVDETLNVEFYPGKKANFTFLSVVGGAHSTELDLMEVLWESFFTGHKRVKGQLIQTTPVKPLVPDAHAVALAIGASQAYVDNKLVGMERGSTLLVDDTVYIPVAFLEKAFPGTKLTFADNGLSAELSKGKVICRVALGHRMMVVDNRVQATAKFIEQEGVLYAPVKDMAKYFYGWNVSDNSGTIYISSHSGHLTFDTALTIKSILSVEQKPAIDLPMEQKYVKRILDAREKEKASSN